MRLDGATFLLQWAGGGLLCCWVTTRRRTVGPGYGWLLRSFYGGLAVLAAALFATRDLGTARAVALVAAVCTAAAAAVALGSSIARRGAGVSGHSAVRARRRARVAAMLASPGAGTPTAESGPDHGSTREFDPRLDLVAPACALVGLGAGAVFAGGPVALAATRLVVGAVFLGAVSDAMLLGHWYLVQPGLSREPVKELVALSALVWPIEVAAFLWPTGMVQVFTGAVDDGWDGLLGVIWAVSAASTVVLVGVTWLALKEKAYAAVMAATGLLYLAILTAFGTDLVARAVLAP